MPIAATHSPTRRPGAWTAGLAVAVTIVGWASAFPAIRVGLEGFGPAELGAIRFAVPVLPAALWLVLRRPPLPARGELWRFAWGGLVFVGLYTLLLNLGQRTVSAGAASFIINASPLITAALAVAALGERFPPRAWLGAAISFGGVGLIALGEGEGLRFEAGALLVLGAAACAATTNVVQKPLFARHDPLTVTAWNLLIGAAMLAPALPAALAQAAAAPLPVLGATLWLGLVPSLVAYATWSVALSRLPAARASNFLYCIPPVATAIGFLWLGETPTALGATGGAMALAGVALVNLKPGRPRSGAVSAGVSSPTGSSRC